MAQAGGRAEEGVFIRWCMRCFNDGFKSGDTCSWGFPRTENLSQGTVKRGTEKELLFFFFFFHMGESICWYGEGNISLGNRNNHQGKIWETEKSQAEVGLVGKQLGV